MTCYFRDNCRITSRLEGEYLSYTRWKEIAMELGYGSDNIFRLQRNALDERGIPETCEMKDRGMEITSQEQY